MDTSHWRFFFRDPLFWLVVILGGFGYALGGWIASIIFLLALLPTLAMELGASSKPLKSSPKKNTPDLGLTGSGKGPDHAD